MAFLKCEQCSCPCIILPMSCMWGGKTRFTQSMQSETIEFLDKAQDEYLFTEDLLGEACAEELCAALNAANLPSSDPDYVALPAHWKKLIDKAKPLLQRGAEWIFVQERGFDCWDNTGVSFDKIANIEVGNLNKVLSMYEARVNAVRSLFMKWWEKNKALYSCAPTNEKNPCEPDEYISNWGAVGCDFGVEPYIRDRG